MKLLHLEIKSCMSCPFMAIVGDTETTVRACENQDALGITRNRHKVITILADVEIPEWCPLEAIDDIPPERWYVIHGDKEDYRLESTKGNYIMLADCIPLKTAKSMAAAPELADQVRQIVRMSGVSTSKGEVRSLGILRETLWEVYQLLEKYGIEIGCP